MGRIVQDSGHRYRLRGAALLTLEAPWRIVPQLFF